MYDVVVLKNSSVIIIIVRSSNKKLSKKKLNFDWFGDSEKNFDFRFSIFIFRFSFFDFVLPEGILKILETVFVHKIRNVATITRN